MLQVWRGVEPIPYVSTPPSTLVLLDADKEEELEPTPKEIIDEPSTLNLQTLSLHLSPSTYWGFTPHHTFKVKGTIQGSEVIGLVDLGAEANFLSTHIVSSLGLPLSQMWSFQVEVGNGATEPGVGSCENVELIVQGVSIVANFLVMELERSEVVLDAGWVASLGRFEGDYQRLTLSLWNYCNNLMMFFKNQTVAGGSILTSKHSTR